MKSSNLSLFERFQILVTKDPSQKSISWLDTWYSRKEILYKMNSMIQVLSEKGVGPGNTVIFYGENHPLSLILPLVCSAIGCRYLPVPNSVPQDLFHEATNWLNGKIIFNPKNNLEDSTEYLNADTLWNLAAVAKHDYSRPLANGFELLFLTSGSTGKPKMISLGEEHILANLETASIHQNLTEEDIVLCGLSLAQSGGLCIQSLPSLVGGSQIVLLPKLTVESFVYAVSKHSPKVTLVVPSFLRMLKLSKKSNQELFQSFRLIGIGSAPLDRPLADYCVQMNIPLMNIYGLTEAGPFAVYTSLNELSEENLIAAGTPASGIEAKLSEEASGRLLLRGKAVQPKLFANSKYMTLTDSEGWYDTGDTFKKSDGVFTFLYRNSDLVNIGGYKVNTINIEQTLMQFPGITGAAVFSKNHPLLGEILVACVEIRESDNKTKKALNSYCKENLPRHTRPRKLLFLKNYPAQLLERF